MFDQGLTKGAAASHGPDVAFGDRATLYSALFSDGRLGLVTTLQCEPFQCSTSGCSEVLVVIPTAQTELAETAAIPKREFPPEPGLGLVTTLQREPFQCSVSVCAIPPALLSYPTAQTSLAETAVTPSRMS